MKSAVKEATSYRIDEIDDQFAGLLERAFIRGQNHVHERKTGRRMGGHSNHIGIQILVKKIATRVDRLIQNLDLLCTRVEKSI
jgi:hypothetical protein